MKRQYLLTTAGLALVAVALILNLSCGGSGGGTNPYTKITGDTTDATYQTALGAAGFSVQFTEGMMRDVIRMADTISPVVFGGGIVVDTVAGGAKWHPDSKYWVSIDTQAAGGESFTYVDSIQFLQGTIPVQFPDSLPDTLSITALKIGSARRQTFDTKPDSLLVWLSATLTGPPGVFANRGNIVLNGTGFSGELVSGWNVHDPDTACNLIFAFSIQHQDIHLNIASVFDGQGCPTSGVVRQTGILMSDCHGPSDSLDYQQNWMAVTTYDGQNYKYTIENPSTRWVHQASCGPKSPPELTTSKAWFESNVGLWKRWLNGSDSQLQ